MSPEQIELVEKYLEDTISSAEAKRLLDAIGSDPAFRAEFAEALRMNGLLHGSVGPDPSCDRLAEVVLRGIPSRDRTLDSRVMSMIQARHVQAPRSAPPGRGRWTPLRLGVAAAGVLLALLGGWLLGRSEEARVVDAGPGLVLERGSGTSSPGAPFAIAPGDRLRVPQGSWARVRYPDGTILQAGSETSLAFEKPSVGASGKRVRVGEGLVSAHVAPQPADRPMTLASPHSETKVVGTTFSLLVGKEETTLVVREGSVSFSKAQGHDSIQVTSGQGATAAEGRPLAARPVRHPLREKLGKDHFLLGVMSGLGEAWTTETRAQGCRWDLRYQHLSSNWTQWNANGAFIPMYVEDSERLGVLPVFTYYGLVHSTPVVPEPRELAGQLQKTTASTASMRRYLMDLKLFMVKAGETRKPMILHAEPGVWNQFLTAPEFRPNDPAGIHVGVHASGLPELDELDDSAAAFGKAFGVLRDRYAPNVLLAWHLTRSGGLTPARAAEALRVSGTWDLVFTDVGDRDAGFMEAHGTANAWWKDQDFTEVREWGREVYARTGLPLMVWRIPLGNTHMAACNNTPWHYMDNRAEYWLEDYPANPHLAEWSEAGFVGLLFGGGTVECTVHRDNAKDGVTNPPPVPGNKGERSEFPDDDGGYLRLRAGAYYRKGPLRSWSN